MLSLVTALAVLVHLVRATLIEPSSSSSSNCTINKHPDVVSELRTITTDMAHGGPSPIWQAWTMLIMFALHGWPLAIHTAMFITVVMICRSPQSFSCTASPHPHMIGDINLDTFPSEDTACSHLTFLDTEARTSLPTFVPTRWKIRRTKSMNFWTAQALENLWALDMTCKLHSCWENKVDVDNRVKRLSTPVALRYVLSESLVEICFPGYRLLSAATRPYSGWNSGAQ